MSETKIRSNIGGTYGIQLPQIHPGDEEDSHHPHPQHGHHQFRLLEYALRYDGYK